MFQYNYNKRLALKCAVVLMFFVGCFGVPYFLISYIDVKDNFLGEGALIRGGDIFDPQYDSEAENKKLIDPSAIPIQAECGVYVKSFGNFDYAKNSFFINFYIWWILTAPDYYPEKTMEITNAQEYKLLWTARDKTEEKIRIQARYTGTINQDWDMKHFPFDRQKIRVSLEDNIGDINHVRFSPISHNSKISPDIMLRGWELVRFDFVEEPHEYGSNFGDLEHPNTITSRLNIIFELKRDGWKIFFVYFIGYIVSLFLSILTYFTPRRYFGETITLCLGAIFSGIGNKYQLDNSISSVSGLSLSGITTICTFSVILLTIINVVVTHVLYMNERKKLSNCVNYSVLILWILVYAFIVQRAIQAAVQS